MRLAPMQMRPRDAEPRTISESEPEHTITVVSKMLH
jgi:hypothetical protein